jgi:hypothetical protein
VKTSVKQEAPPSIRWSSSLSQFPYKGCDLKGVIGNHKQKGKGKQLFQIGMKEVSK